MEVVEELQGSNRFGSSSTANGVKLEHITKAAGREMHSIYLKMKKLADRLSLAPQLVSW